MSTRTLPAEILAKTVKDENGVVSIRLSKDVLRTGIYIHPKKKWRWEVDAKLLSRMAETGNAMAAAGREPEATTDHSGSVKAVIGHLKSFYVSGDTLMAEHEIKGEDNIHLALVAKNTSCEFDENFVDESGKEWGPAITANSIVQQPVMGKQKGFRIAASLRSLDSERTGCYLLSMANENTPADETPEALAAKHAETVAAHAAVVAENETLKLSLADANEKVAAAEQAKVTAEKAALEASEAHTSLKKKMSLAADDSEAATQLFDERAESVKEKFLSMVGHKVEITKALVDELIPALTAGENRRFLLSRSAETEAPAKAIVAALAKAAKPAGTKTGIQMSRNADQGGEDETKEDEVDADMVKAVGGTPKAKKAKSAK